MTGAELWPAAGSVDEVLLRAAVARLREKALRLADRKGRPLRFMEVCGTHTVALSRSGLRSLLADCLHFVSGPGCPVCVTPAWELNQLQTYALRPHTLLATFGDLLRVPDGRGVSLSDVRSQGGRVQVVISALQAVELAAQQPQVEVVFAAVGFETTAPATALALAAAERRQLRNFYCHVSHKLTPPAVFALLQQGGAPALDGFICPGHVSTVIGSEAWRPLARDFGFPAVVAGFETYDLLVALHTLLHLCDQERPELRNCYRRVVRPEGNPRARELLKQYFEPVAAEWRGLGVVPASGLTLRSAYRGFAAAEALGVDTGEKPSTKSGAPGDTDGTPSRARRLAQACRCADILTGRLLPPECPLFGRRCTPANPVGPCMVSSEGSCAAYYLYGS